jgi:hypothetical protein
VGIAGAEYTDWWPGNGIMAWALNRSLIEHSAKGGIVQLHFHPRNPVAPKIGQPGEGSGGDWTGWWGPSSGGAQVTADLVLNPGPVHDGWMRVLDDAAAGLRELRDNGVVVLWRPMHARDGASWWWSYANLPQEDYNRIWSHMVDYFSNAWGLDNILYMQSWYYGFMPETYAGDGNVDIVALDHGEDPASSYDAEYANMLSLGKPFGISQGSIGDARGDGDYDLRQEIALIKNRWPRCSFFIQFDYDHDYAWADSLRLDIPGNRFAREMLSDPWVVNAGEIFSAPPSPCGNGTCDNGEDCSSCPSDCACSDYSCPDGQTCDGSGVTGTPGQIVCGGDLMSWRCTETGWQQTGDACSCEP